MATLINRVVTTPSWLDLIPRLRKLSASSQALLIPLAFTRQLGPGETLVEQGTPARFFFLMKRGYLKWERSNSWGSSTIIDIHGSCEAPGELAVRMGTPYPASGIAITTTQVVGFPRLLYLDLLRSDPGFSSVSSFCLASRAYGLLGRVAEDSEPDVEHRLSAFILRLVFKFGTQTSTQFWTLPFYLSRKDFSAAVSCRIETTIRIMKKWENSGKMATTPHTMQVSQEFVLRIKAIQESESLYFGSECTHCKEST